MPCSGTNGGTGICLSKPLDVCFVSYIARDQEQKLKGPGFPYLHKVKVNSVDLLCFVDTGCSRLLIEYDLIRKFFQHKI